MTAYLYWTGDESDDEITQAVTHHRELAQDDRVSRILCTLGDALFEDCPPAPVSWPRRAWNALMVLIPC